MKFLSQIFDFMFAPAGTFDADSGLWGAANDNSVGHAEPLTINPATNLPMIENAGIDVMGSPFGIDVHHQVDAACANDTSMFNHDCSSIFDSSSSSFDSGSMFNSDWASSGTGSMFD